MANQLLLGRALDANGYIMPGAKATITASGTATLIPVYSDADGTVPAANPIIADGNGFFPQSFVDDAARAAITDANDVAVLTLDPAPFSLTAGSSASQVGFTPSVAVPESNVQDAIDFVANSVLSGVSAFGIGITGNADLLANVNATNIPAGAYRFDGTTTGTFPTGVAAADTGLVEHWRQSSSAAMQFLFHATTDRVFHRRMASSTWQTWREVITAPQGAAEGDLLFRGASAWQRLAKGTAGQYLRMNTGANAPEWVANPAGWDFTSTNQTISNTITVAHGLGQIPTRFDVVLVCTTADLGYSVGDVVPVIGFTDVPGISSITYSLDATNINVRASGIGWRFNNKDTNTTAGITNTSWRMVLRASR